MKTRAKFAKVSFLAVGILTHITRGAAAMLPNSSALPPLAPLPPREPFPDALIDKSRLRLAESAEPPLAQVWAAGMRGSLPIDGGDSFDQVMARVALAEALQDPQFAQLNLSQPVQSLHINEPPSPVTTPSFQQQSQAQTTRALNAYPSLTPVQRISIRDYVGSTKNEVEEMSFNGKELLILRDPQTHEYRGEVTISPTDDGSVQVTKLTGATLDFSKSVDVPILSGPKEEVPKELEAEVKKDVEITVPAIKVEGKAELGPVSESTLVLHPDGSGYETGRRTNLASASAGAEISAGGSAEEGFAGIKGGIGAQALKVEGFVNYLGKPEADETGKLTREVYGITGDAHTTLAEIGGQAGCSDKGGCGGKFSMGLLGIGLGGSLSHGTVKVGEEAAEGNPEKGLASTSAEVEQADAPEMADPPSVDAAEAADRQSNGAASAQKDAAPADGASDGTTDALHKFVNQYPDKTGDQAAPPAQGGDEATPPAQGAHQATPSTQGADQATSPAQGGDETTPPAQGGDNHPTDQNPPGSNDQPLPPDDQPTPGQEHGPY